MYRIRPKQVSLDVYMYTHKTERTRYIAKTTTIAYNSICKLKTQNACNLQHTNHINIS